MRVFCGFSGDWCADEYSSIEYQVLTDIITRQSHYQDIQLLEKVFNRLLFLKVNGRFCDYVSRLENVDMSCGITVLRRSYPVRYDMPY